MLRRVLTRLTAALLLCVFFSLSAFAQGGYGTGTGGTGTGGTYTPPSGGYKSSTGIAIGAGAAAAATVAYLALRKPHIVGCIEPSTDGLKLMNEKDQNTYTLDANGSDLKPGARVELRGKKEKDTSGKLTFRVSKVSHDYGTCKQ
jgi:hypothetical protein